MTRLLLLLSSLQLPAAEVPPQPKHAYSFEAGSTRLYENSMQLGLRITPVRTGQAIFDVAVATFPDAITHGFFLFMFDVDMAFGTPVAGPEMVLLPRVGLTMIGGSSSEGGGAVAAYNVGIGVFARPSQEIGFRIDYTLRRLLDASDTEPFSSVTFGVVLIR